MKATLRVDYRKGGNWLRQSCFIGPAPARREAILVARVFGATRVVREEPGPVVVAVFVKGSGECVLEINAMSPGTRALEFAAAMRAGDADRACVIADAPFPPAWPEDFRRPWGAKRELARMARRSEQGEGK